MAMMVASFPSTETRRLPKQARLFLCQHDNFRGGGRHGNHRNFFSGNLSLWREECLFYVDLPHFVSPCAGELDGSQIGNLMELCDTAAPSISFGPRYYWPGNMSNTVYDRRYRAYTRLDRSVPTMADAPSWLRYPPKPRWQVIGRTRRR
jgi:hypothetical protein